MRKAHEIIEVARSYYLLSKDHRDTSAKPIFIGGRIKLEYALDDVGEDMVIATAGNAKRCVILMDYSTEECLSFKQKGEAELMRLKAKN